MMVTNLFEKKYSSALFSLGLSQENVQPNIDLSQGLAKPVGPLGRGLLEMRLGAVQRLKQGNDITLVGLLGGGEARLVHAVVDLVVLPLVRLVDLRAESFRVELDLAVLFVDEVVELLPALLTTSCSRSGGGINECWWLV